METDDKTEQTKGADTVATETLRRVKVTEMAMVALTAVIALSSVTTCWVYKGQLDVMQDTLDEIKTSGVDTHYLVKVAGKQATALTDSIGPATTSAARAAETSAKNSDRIARGSEDTVKAAQASMRLDQRAWIGVKATSITAVEGQPFSVKVEVTNTGKTPALNAHGLTNAEEIVVGVGKLTSEATWANSVEAGVTWSRATVYPGGTVFGSVKDSGVLTRDGIALVTKGTHRIYVRVVYDYDDIFGRPHKLRYCGVLSRDLTTLEQCDSGNYAD